MLKGTTLFQSGALAPTGLRWDWVLTKYHPFGFALWAVHVAELDRAYHHDIAATPQGHLLAVSSEIGTNGVRDCVTRRLGSDGSLLWETRDSGTNGANCEPWELRTDPLGNSYVLVTVHGDPNESQALVSATRRDTPCTLGPAVQPTRKAGALGCGRSRSGGSGHLGGLAKLGPTGEVLWQTNRWCYCVKTDAQGFVYTYEHWPAYAIVKRDPAGQVLWSAPVYGYIEPDRSGNLYAWGLSYPQYQVSRLDGATGRVLWGRRGLDQTGDPPDKWLLTPPTTFTCSPPSVSGYRTPRWISPGCARLIHKGTCCGPLLMVWTVRMVSSRPSCAWERRGMSL